jgi:hypothetical protein
MQSRAEELQAPGRVYVSLEDIALPVGTRDGYVGKHMMTDSSLLMIVAASKQ